MTADITISTIMILILNLLARVSLFIRSQESFFRLIDFANIQKKQYKQNFLQRK